MKHSRHTALLATLLVPFGLLHAFVLAEICIADTDILFLIESWRTRNFAWARQTWFIIALVWWGWLVLCTIPWPGVTTAGLVMGVVQALVIIRLLVFAAALQSWVLTTPTARRALWLALALSVLWIGLESWQQYFTGHNIFGNPRWSDGSLTGPFWKPRAGAVYGHLVMVAALLPVMALLSRPGRVWQIAGMGLMALAVVTSILIGQRMGAAFSLFSLALAGLLLKPLRRATAIAFAAAALVLLATPIISPATHGKLVNETATNMGHFSQSPYGELYTRATNMGLASPWHGWGYNGFREFCPQSRFDGGLPALNIPTTQIALGACNLHPHNFYLQALTDAGIPGLILFITLNFAWLWALWRGIWRGRDTLRIALFIGALTFIWPVASTDEFPTLYTSGWFFLMLGLSLAVPYMLPNTTELETEHA
ncbi:MAG: O-antigen ligase family protein [Acidocella sp.]|nr:O-antigen ligase family protein [Acidocella sp.]